MTQVAQKLAPAEQRCFLHDFGIVRWSRQNIPKQRMRKHPGTMPKRCATIRHGSATFVTVRKYSLGRFSQCLDVRKMTNKHYGMLFQHTGAAADILLLQQ